jgi:hypothetical protein
MPSAGEVGLSDLLAAGTAIDVSDTQASSDAVDGADRLTTSHPVRVTGASASQVRMARRAKRMLKHTRAGRRLLNTVSSSNVRINVMPTRAYTKQFPSWSIAVADQWYTGTHDAPVVEVNADAFRRERRFQRASTLAHELQHVVDFRYPSIVQSRSEARAYTRQDHVETQLGHRPGPRAFSRDDRTGKLLSLTGVQRAVCKNSLYAAMYREYGTYEENCGQF